MRRLALIAAAIAALLGCADRSGGGGPTEVHPQRLFRGWGGGRGCADRSGGGERTELYLQRFFGECGAVYGRSTDVAAAEGECGIVTALINKFNAENPDVHVEVNVIAWPGYAQLAAQLAARDPPDLVTMHQDFIADYVVRGLLEPMDEVLRAGGIGPEHFTAAARRPPRDAPALGRDCRGPGPARADGRSAARRRYRARAFHRRRPPRRCQER